MKSLHKKREEIQQLQAPEVLEARLHKALKSSNKKSKVSKLFVIAALFTLVVTVMNYQVLAYYGQQFFGYDHLMSQSLAKMNEEHRGQSINQSTKLADGTLLTIEGIIADSNRFHVYYRLKNESGVDETIRLERITGFWTDEYMNYGTVEMNATETEGVGIQTFDAVSPFAKQLKIHVASLTEEQEFVIPYDASAAVPVTLKAKLHDTFSYDYGKLRFKEIVATQASTVIRGGMTKEDDRNFGLDFSGIQLFADGKIIDQIQTSHETNLFGSSFEMMYEAVPKGTRKLEIRMHTFNGYAQVDEQVALEGKQIIADSWIDIQQITQQEGKTYVMIASDESVYFDDVYLVTAGADVALEIAQRDETAQINTRTLIFETVEEALALRVGGVYYMKRYDKKIEMDL